MPRAPAGHQSSPVFFLLTPHYSARRRGRHGVIFSLKAIAPKSGVMLSGCSGGKLAKNALIHSFRHRFATHLLEHGTDIRYIKDLLGHTSIRTTERYTHVAKKKALKIPSPLDTF
jgi:integrase